MERILITEELTAFLNSMPVVNVDNIPITHSLIIRDLSKLSLANDESNPTHNSYIGIFLK